MPCGWYPKIYFLVGGKDAERCRRAGKYDANRDQTGEDRRRLERWESVPEVPALENRMYKRYGRRSGQVRGMAAKRKKVVRKQAMHKV